MANRIDTLHARIETLTAKLLSKHEEAMVRLEVYGNADPRTIKFFAKCMKIRQARDLAKYELRQAMKALRVRKEIWIAGKELGDSRKVGVIDVLRGDFTPARGAPE